MTESKRLAAVLASAAVVAAVVAYLAKDALLAPATQVVAPAARPAKAAAPARPAAVAGPRVVRMRDGSPRDLASRTGKGLILHFWATWCPPCREEMPDLVKFVKDTKGDANVEFLSVSADESWKIVDAWLRKNGIDGLPVALDPKGPTASLYGVTGYPETFFITPSGEIVEHLIGPADWNTQQLRTFVAEFSRASGAQRTN
jgi:thiol-disulfide isomerase/thioredoxin